MLLKEYRIVLPVTLEEYQIGQLYAVAEGSRHETGGGDGVEILINQSFKDRPLFNNMYSTGQYTKKKYHLSRKVTGFVRAVVPEKSLVFEENAWNAYPYCRTILTNDFFGDRFKVTIESLHLQGSADVENAHNLSSEQLKNREVVIIDIASDLEDSPEYDPDIDPRKYHSEKTNRGPLLDGWMHSTQPIMTCYKLVRCHVELMGFEQVRLEKFIHASVKKILKKLHKHLFCWLDHWYGLTMDDIRRMEGEVARELEEQRANGQIRGYQLEE